MANTVSINGVQFIDFTKGNYNVDKLYCLNDEIKAETLGVFTTESKLVDAINTCVGSGKELENLWGVMYPADVLIKK